MNDPFQMQKELRYGAPVCDHILTGRILLLAIHGISDKQNGHLKL